jgi:hypothetical protein
MYTIGRTSDSDKNNPGNSAVMRVRIYFIKKIHVKEVLSFAAPEHSSVAPDPAGYPVSSW